MTLTVVHLTHDGITLSAEEWARRPEIAARGIDAQILRVRRCQGWSDARSLETPCIRRGPNHRDQSIDVLYADDPDAQRFVAEHPDGATAELVAEALGLPISTVQHIEQRALARLRKRAPLARLHELLDGLERELALERLAIAELAGDIDELALDLPTKGTAA